jgi:hypothetical protein
MIVGDGEVADPEPGRPGSVMGLHAQARIADRLGHAKQFDDEVVHDRVRPAALA